MARVEYPEVRQLLADDLEPGVIPALIDDAHGWIGAHLTGKGLGEATLALIEKYLAAHLAILASEGGEGQLVASARADMSDKYADRSQAGDATSFLRTAAAYDRSGTVRELWLGGRRAKGRVGRGYDKPGSGP